MAKVDYERIVIKCIQENMELSGEPVPQIAKSTKPACDLSGFDSLRTLEVLVSIEEKIGCELPPDKIFSDIQFEDVTVSTIVNAIIKIKKEDV